ncbi:hypothetical protein BH23PLA1_BH23PLA1_00370 [soil metagenome]
MRSKSSRRMIVLGALGALLLAAPMATWHCLSYEPDFYRKRAAIEPERRKAQAHRFEEDSLRLRNDIVNEDQWEAIFTDEEVNAWMAEHLVTHFSDQLPPGVHQPMVAFDLDRVTLAFQLERGRLRSLVWVVARVRLAEENTVALTLEKIRAGAIPVPAEEIIHQITEAAIGHGLEIRWEDRDGEPVALIGYSPSPGRIDVVLERLQVLEGRLFIGGRSEHGNGRIANPTLPDRRVLQSTFPRRAKPPIHQAM